MATVAMRRQGSSPLRRQETRAGLLFILPWLIALLVFTAYPVAGHVLPLLYRLQHPPAAKLDWARELPDHLCRGPGVLDGGAQQRRLRRRLGAAQAGRRLWPRLAAEHGRARHRHLSHHLLSADAGAPDRRHHRVHPALFPPRRSDQHDPLLGRDPGPGLVQRPELGHAGVDRAWHLAARRGNARLSRRIEGDSAGSPRRCLR